MTRRWILDSGPAQDYLFERHGVVERIRDARMRGLRIGICIPILAEILAGLECSSRRDEFMPIALLRLRHLHCWPFDYPACLEYGKIVSVLKQLGRPMQTMDIQLAAIAITMKRTTIITYDNDFLAIPGLSVENWRS